MEYENFKTLALNRQSCRDFNGELVEKEKLKINNLDSVLNKYR